MDNRDIKNREMLERDIQVRNDEAARAGASGPAIALTVAALAAVILGLVYFTTYQPVETTSAPAPSTVTPPPAGTTGQRTPPAGTTGQQTPPAGTTGQQTPPAGTSGQATPPAGTSGQPTPR
jgi:hypothetical protein